MYDDDTKYYQKKQGRRIKQTIGESAQRFVVGYLVVGIDFPATSLALHAFLASSRGVAV